MPLFRGVVQTAPAVVGEQIYVSAGPHKDPHALGVSLQRRLVQGGASELVEVGGVDAAGVDLEHPREHVELPARGREVQLHAASVVLAAVRGHGRGGEKLGELGKPTGLGDHLRGLLFNIARAQLRAGVHEHPAEVDAAFVRGAVERHEPVALETVGTTGRARGRSGGKERDMEQISRQRGKAGGNIWRA